jgi:hypothetical protein
MNKLTVLLLGRIARRELWKLIKQELKKHII